MKALSVLGTIAMFLVGGGIVVHGVAPLHHAIEHWAQGLGGVGAAVMPTVLNLVLGFIIGAVVLAAVSLIGRLRGKPAH
ncbi:Putative inner membrane protein [Cronobacter dublinensis 582]|nr:Putative inner membrane protein [Cronobacter dublinensis 582]